MQTIRYALQDGIATVTFDEPNSPVNTMCLQWQQDMDALAAQVLQDKDSIRGIILDSTKSTFFAGADLKSTMRLEPSDAPRVFGGGQHRQGRLGARRKFAADHLAFDLKTDEEKKHRHQAVVDPIQQGGGENRKMQESVIERRQGRIGDNQSQGRRSHQQQTGGGFAFDKRGDRGNRI